MSNINTHLHLQSFRSNILATDIITWINLLVMKVWHHEQTFTWILVNLDDF